MAAAVRRRSRTASGRARWGAPARSSSRRARSRGPSGSARRGPRRARTRRRRAEACPARRRCSGGRGPVRRGAGWRAVRRAAGRARARRARGVPHTLQNLSVGLATVPHCEHALMVSPFVPSARPVPMGERGAQREHIEVARKSASCDVTGSTPGSRAYARRPRPRQWPPEHLAHRHAVGARRRDARVELRLDLRRPEGARRRSSPGWARRASRPYSMRRGRSSAGDVVAAHAEARRLAEHRVGDGVGALERRERRDASAPGRPFFIVMGVAQASSAPAARSASIQLAASSPVASSTLASRTACVATRRAAAVGRGRRGDGAPEDGAQDVRPVASARRCPRPSRCAPGAIDGQRASRWRGRRRWRRPSA